MPPHVPLSGAAAPRPATPPERVRVDLGARGYDILIGPGLTAASGALLAALHPGARAMVVTDEAVAPLHLPSVMDGLSGGGVAARHVVVPAGEQAKSWPVLEEVVDAILAARLERGDVVVALGGGVVGDLAGFAAAIARRGMPFVQMPTTLLAQVDSSVGGKTGINTPHGKNLVGAFHQPGLVIADIDHLATLPARQMRAGYAEVAKYAFIGDRDLFDWLERRREEIFALGPAVATAVARSCEAKAKVVAADEREAGERALLNLGHTFGHALEAEAGYGETLVHGEAVAIGMAMAFRYSVRRGLCPPRDAALAVAHLREAGLPTRVADVAGLETSADRLLEAMRQDKKTERGRLRLVLVRGIGRAFVTADVDVRDLATFLEEELSS